MSWLYGQTWLWYFIAFLVGLLLAWLFLVRPQQRRLAERSRTGPHPVEPATSAGGARSRAPSETVTAETAVAAGAGVAAGAAVAAAGRSSTADDRTTPIEDQRQASATPARIATPPVHQDGEEHRPAADTVDLTKAPEAPTKDRRPPSDTVDGRTAAATPAAGAAAESSRDQHSRPTDAEDRTEDLRRRPDAGEENTEAPHAMAAGTATAAAAAVGAAAAVASTRDRSSDTDDGEDPRRTTDTIDERAEAAADAAPTEERGGDHRLASDPGANRTATAAPATEAGAEPAQDLRRVPVEADRRTEDLRGTPSSADAQFEDPRPTSSDADSRPEDLRRAAGNADGRTEDLPPTQSSADGQADEPHRTPSDAEGRTEDLRATADARTEESSATSAAADDGDPGPGAAAAVGAAAAAGVGAAAVAREVADDDRRPPSDVNGEPATAAPVHDAAAESTGGRHERPADPDAPTEVQRPASDGPGERHAAAAASTTGSATADDGHPGPNGTGEGTDAAAATTGVGEVATEDRSPDHIEGVALAHGGAEEHDGAHGGAEEQIDDRHSTPGAIDPPTEELHHRSPDDQPTDWFTTPGSRSADPPTDWIPIVDAPTVTFPATDPDAPTVVLPAVDPALSTLDTATITSADPSGPHDVDSLPTHEERPDDLPSTPPSAEAAPHHTDPADEPSTPSAETAGADVTSNDPSRPDLAVARPADQTARTDDPTEHVRADPD